MRRSEKKLTNPKAICLHTVKSGKYSTISPGESLTPINGKIFWHIDESTITADMEKYKVIYAFEQAFKAWQPYLGSIIFEATGVKDSAQIVISFKTNGQPGLPEAFGPNVLAYAYAPSGTSLGLYADLYVNDAYRWDEIHKPGGFFLFKVVVHEIGHALNLGHQTNDFVDIMYPVYQPNGNVVINKDNQKGLYDLYSKYGVKNPIGGGETSILKSVFTSRADVSRLNISQLTTLGNYLGVTFTPRDSISTRISKVFAAIQQL